MSSSSFSFSSSRRRFNSGVGGSSRPASEKITQDDDDDPPPGSARAHIKRWTARRRAAAAAARNGRFVPPPAAAAPAPDPAPASALAPGATSSSSSSAAAPTAVPTNAKASPPPPSTTTTTTTSAAGESAERTEGSPGNDASAPGAAPSSAAAAGSGDVYVFEDSPAATKRPRNGTDGGGRVDGQEGGRGGTSLQRWPSASPTRGNASRKRPRMADDGAGGAGGSAFSMQAETRRKVSNSGPASPTTTRSFAGPTAAASDGPTRRPSGVVAATAAPKPTKDGSGTRRREAGAGAAAAGVASSACALVDGGGGGGGSTAAGGVGANQDGRPNASPNGPATASATTAALGRGASAAASEARNYVDLTLDDSDSDSDWDSTTEDGIVGTKNEGRGKEKKEAVKAEEEEEEEEGPMESTAAAAGAAGADASARTSSASMTATEGGALAKGADPAAAAASSSSSSAAAKADDGPIPDPIIPTAVPPPPTVTSAASFFAPNAQSAAGPRGPRWSTVGTCLLVRTHAASRANNATRTANKVAAFDLDGTLLLWRCAGWPSQLDHYELWSASVLPRLRSLYDSGFALVLFTNQGGIRSALAGKTATRVKAVIDWLANVVERPLNAVVSTKKDGGYHKPSPNMWEVAERRFNGGREFDLAESFYVGDSASEGEGAGDDPDDPQGGVDRRFALNVGEMRGGGGGGGGGGLQFFTPEKYFGVSDSERRKAARAVAADAGGYEVPPEEALKVRAALLGGYLAGPVMIILVGVQGSGKSTFSNRLLLANESSSSSSASSTSNWVHLSQDTIRNGRPGTRQAVESAALTALQSDGRSVIVDRMHLTPDQRAHFTTVARQAGDIPVHAIFFDVPKSVIERRVRDRAGREGGVEGERGARMAAANVDKLVPPRYDEGMALVSRVRDVEGVRLLSEAYRRVVVRAVPTKSNASFSAAATSPPALRLPSSFALRGNNADGNDGGAVALPSIVLGTMKMGKRTASTAVASALRVGFTAVDTAPTYNNEEEVGRGLLIVQQTPPTFVVIKIPKRATTSSQARSEVMDSLRRLNLQAADLALLHWPSDCIEADTLGQVWSELGRMRGEGLIRSIGVSNFSVGALKVLLSLCESRSSYPSVNQVERHPLLPQWELVEYCAKAGIVVQAHSCLGHGELIKHPAVLQAAKEAGMSVSQLLIGFNLAHGVGVVTKSVEAGRQKTAVATLKMGGRLTPEVMKRLDSIAVGRKVQARFVDPPFMYKRGAPYSWGDKWQKRR